MLPSSDLGYKRQIISLPQYEQGSVEKINVNSEKNIRMVFSSLMGREKCHLEKIRRMDSLGWTPRANKEEVNVGIANTKYTILIRRYGFEWIMCFFHTGSKVIVAFQLICLVYVCCIVTRQLHWYFYFHIILINHLLPIIEGQRIVTQISLSLFGMKVKLSLFDNSDFEV